MTVTDSFGKKNMSSIKGLAALLVVMVHILPQYQNPIQDAIGSFAYIAVTLFFFASAYGMEFSIDHNPRYLNTFWRKRLVLLLVPMLLTNVISMVYRLSFDVASPMRALIALNHYVSVLLQYCVAYYIVHLLGRHYKFSKKTELITLAIIVFISSLVDYFCFDKSNWSYERMGLVWGLIGYHCHDRIMGAMSNAKLPLMLTRLAVICLACMVLGGLYLKLKAVPFWGEYVLKVVLGLAIITLVFFATAHINIINNVTQFLGRISYPIYLCHDVIMLIIAALAPGVASWPFILMTYAATLLTAYIITIVSRPITRLLLPQKN